MIVAHGNGRPALGHAFCGKCKHLTVSQSQEGVDRARSIAKPQGISTVGLASPYSHACTAAARLHTVSQAVVRTGQTSPDPTNANGSQAEVTLLSAKGGTYSVKGVLSTTVAPDSVYSILLDYGRSHKIFTNIKESAVEVDEKGQRVLNQRCHWEFFFFGGTFRALFDLNEDHDNRVLEFEMRNKGFMQRLNGRWHVSDKVDGICQVEYILTVKPLLLPPPPFSGYTRNIFVAQMKQIMEDLDRELCGRMEA